MRKFLLGAACLLVAASLSATANAHDPIIFTGEQISPEDGPLLPDGTVSFALYGVLEVPGDTRGFRVNFAAGDPFYFSVLIPDLEPENVLSDDEVPTLTIVDPTGKESTLVASERVPFSEPFTGTNYVRLIEATGTAIGGTYSLTVTGKVPARFTISVGTREMFGTPVENVPNRDLGVAGVMSWYGTPPPSLPTPETSPPTTDVPSKVEVPLRTPNRSRRGTERRVGRRSTFPSSSCFQPLR